ncbi:MAG: YceI family protein [Gammaproteobacteria bacterium]
MKRFSVYILCILSMIFLVQKAGQAAPETYIFDPTHTYITWNVSHFGFSMLSGKWLAAGTLVLDEEKPKESKVNVTLTMAELNTGVPKLDEHLKGQDFFDVSQFPTATFISDKISVTEKHAKVYGTLKVRGISKPIVLKVKLNKSGINPFSKKQTVGFSGSTELKRSDFGVDKYAPHIGNTVKVIFEAEATR